MAAKLEEGRLYTARAIMELGYMIRHGEGSPYAIEPGKSWPRFELIPDGADVYRVRGRLAKESSFAEWLEARQGTNSQAVPGYSGQKGPGTPAHRKGVDDAAEKDRQRDRRRRHQALAKGKRAVGGSSGEGGGDGGGDDFAAGLTG